MKYDLHPEETRMLRCWYSEDQVFSGLSEWTNPALVPLLEASKVFVWRRRGNRETMRLTEFGKEVWRETRGKYLSDLNEIKHEAEALAKDNLSFSGRK